MKWKSAFPSDDRDLWSLKGNDNQSQLATSRSHTVVSLALISLSSLVVLLLRSRFLNQKRMELLKKITTPSNPRFGVNHSIVCFMEYLRAFFGADSCFLVLQDPENEAYSLRQVKRNDETVDESATALAPDVADLLMSFPPEGAVIYHSPRPHRGWESLQCVDVHSGKKCPLNDFSASKVTNLVGCHFLSLPLVCHKNTVKLEQLRMIFLWCKRAKFRE